MRDVQPTQRERPVAIIGNAPPPPFYRRPRRAVLAYLHTWGYGLWVWAGDRLDDDQERLKDPTAEGYIETLEETAETFLMRAERAERENGELSEMVGQWHEKWKKAYNRLRDYEDRDGSSV